MGMTALREVHRYQKFTKLLCSKRPFMRLIKGSSHDSIVDGNSPVYPQQSIMSKAAQEMAEAFLVREFESELSYMFSYNISPTYCYLATLVSAIHAKRVMITLKEIEVVDSLRVMNGGKS
jgi:histone H3/H4